MDLEVRVVTMLGTEQRVTGAWPTHRGSIVLGGIRPPQPVDGVQVFPKFDVRAYHDPSAYERIPLPALPVPQLVPGQVPDSIRQGLPASWGTFGGAPGYLVYRSLASHAPIVDYSGGLEGTSMHVSFDGPRVTFERNGDRVELYLDAVPADSCGVLSLSWDGPSLTAWYGFKVHNSAGPPALELYSRSEDQRQLRRQATLAVNDYLLGRYYYLGGPGVSLGPQVITFGDDAFLASSNNASTLIDVDLPFELPVTEDEYSFVFDGAEVRFVHSLKWRGEERFSTLDSTRLSRFSHLAITAPGFREGFVKQAGLAGTARADFPAAAEPTLDEHLRSYALICAIVDKVFAAAQDTELVRPLLSYSMTAFDSSGQARARSVVPHAGSVVYGVAHQPPPRFSREQWDAYRQATSIVKAASPARPPVRSEFRDEVVTIVHDYCFFARQQPEVLGKLPEELLRDLLLLVFKTRFASAEAEAFNFDGKADFKVTDPASKYAFVIGELKWWTGTDSAKEVFHQLVRKHSTGQEAALICLLLCRNVDAEKMAESARAVFDGEHECAGAWEPCTPPGSSEYARRTSVRVRNRDIPLYLAVAQLHYTRQ